MRSPSDLHNPVMPLSPNKAMSTQGRVDRSFRERTPAMRVLSRSRCTLVGTLVLWLVGISPAQSQETLEERVQRLEKHAEKLEKQNEMLLKLLNDRAPAPEASAASLDRDEVRQIIGGYLQEKDAQKKV